MDSTWQDVHNVCWLDYQDFKDKSGAFEDLAAYDINFVGLSTDNRAMCNLRSTIANRQSPM